MLDWTDEQYDTYLGIRDVVDRAMHLVSSNEFKMLVFLLSRSYGEGFEAVNLSLPDFYGKGREGFGNTGISKASVIRCIASLQERGLISRTVARSRGGHLYRVEIGAIRDLIED